MAGPATAGHPAMAGQAMAGHPAPTARAAGQATRAGSRLRRCARRRRRPRCPTTSWAPSGRARNSHSPQRRSSTAGPAARVVPKGRTPRDDSLMVAASGRAAAETEVEANGSVAQLRTIPFIVDGERAGALILLREVTELRHRERELLTKDATIREIHHRVKNNLQTVAALLRLQARRLRAPEARDALDEAVRRVRSIAMGHETPSRGP